MKTCKLFFTLGLVAVMSVSALAQTASATMNVTAELLQGLQIVNQVDLNLGSFVLLDGSNQGDLTINTVDGEVTSNGLALVSNPTLGSFSVSGSSGTVGITIDGSVALGDGSISEFTFSPAAQSGSGAFTANGDDIVGNAIISNGVSETILIGGTLAGIGSSDASGSYSGTINITVTYQ